MSCDVQFDTKSWDDFLPYVLPYVSKAPAAAVCHYVRLAAIEFAKSTHALRETICLDTQACQECYSIDLPDGYAMAKVHRVCCGNSEYYPRRRLSCCPTDRGCTYYAELPHDIHLTPAPPTDETGALQVEVSLFPGQDSCEAHWELYSHWAEDIGYGAAARMMLIPESDYFLPQSAGLFDRRFRDAIKRARADKHTQYSAQKMTARSRRRFA